MRFWLLALLLIGFNAQAKIIRQDVRHLSVAGQTALIGDITMSAGSNITLAQSGQNITITSTASASTALNARWALTGAVVPYNDIDGPHYQTSTQSLTTVNLTMLNSGTSGNTSVRLNQYRSGLLNNAQTATVTANAGLPTSSASALTGTLSLLAGDVVTVDITQTASGAPESIAIEY